MDCTKLKGDKLFDENLFKILNIEMEDKIRVFLTICILIRLLIAGLSYQYYDSKYIKYFYIIGAISVIMILYPKLNGDVWWNRKVHLIIALFVLFIAVYQIFYNITDKTIPGILYIDVIFGILTFFYKWNSLC
jgi:hypothetical protein